MAGTAPAGGVLAVLGAAPAGTPVSDTGPSSLHGSEAPPSFTLSTHIDSPIFAPALGLQLSVLARDGIEQARMQLNPQEMGPIGVQLTVAGQQVQVDFVCDQARTRQVLEQSMQQLATSLADAGFTMTGGGVSQQTREGLGGRQGSAEDNSARHPGGPGGGSGSEPVPEPGAAARPRAQRGLVDLYA